MPTDIMMNMISQAIAKQYHKCKGTVAFYRELLLHPKSVGAVCPSSKNLTRHIAKAVPLDGEGSVIELGAGTGAVIEALLEHRTPPRRIIAIENSKKLAAYLKERFPHITVMHGNAMALHELLDQQSVVASTIISSLPLRSLPENQREKIIQQIALSLQPGGQFIQYTYGFKPPTWHAPNHCTLDHSTRIWRNIPPARIDVFTSHKKVS